MQAELQVVFSRLNDREQFSVILSLVFVLVVVVYLLFWKPIFQELDDYRYKVDSSYDEFIWMSGAASVWEQYKKKQQTVRKAGLPKGKSLLGVVDSSAKRYKLKNTLRRIEPDGNDGVKLTFEEGSFDVLIKWLGMMEKKYGVVIARINVSRQEKPGVVNARVFLQVGE